MDAFRRKLLDSARYRKELQKGNPAPPAARNLADPKSIHHKAASYAVWALVASFVVNGLSSGLADPNRAPIVQVIISATLGFLVLSAIPAGVIALCGIPRYGKEKLLWKGLVGVLAPLAMFALAVPAFRAEMRANENDARQEQPDANDLVFALAGRRFATKSSLKTGAASRRHAVTTLTD